MTVGEFLELTYYKTNVEIWAVNDIGALECVYFGYKLSDNIKKCYHLPVYSWYASSDDLVAIHIEESYLDEIYKGEVNE